MLVATVGSMAWCSTTRSSPSGKSVAFTTPLHYASRLCELCRSRGLNPLWCPTIEVRSTPQAIHPYLVSLEDHFSAIAFTSRAGISAFSEALNHVDRPPLSPGGDGGDAFTFTVSALGRDADLLFHQDFASRLCPNPTRLQLLVPPLSTPAAMVESLGPGHGRRVLCPVPLVIGLEEPPVIPDFVRALTRYGWLPVKVCAYETRWSGPRALQDLLLASRLDTIIFTSTAEVEGFLKSLGALGFEWGMVKARWPPLVVAAHGPVTAAGAERLGVAVDVVSSNFGSFDGVLDALLLHWENRNSN